VEKPGDSTGYHVEMSVEDVENYENRQKQEKSVKIGFSSVDKSVDIVDNSL